jgi:hypothetical protein
VLLRFPGKIDTFWRGKPHQKDNRQGFNDQNYSGGDTALLVGDGLCLGGSGVLGFLFKPHLQDVAILVDGPAVFISLGDVKRNGIAANPTTKGLFDNRRNNFATTVIRDLEPNC